MDLGTGISREIKIQKDCGPINFGGLIYINNAVTNSSNIQWIKK